MFKHKDHAFTVYDKNYKYLICENCGKKFIDHFNLCCTGQELELLEKNISTGVVAMKPFDLEAAKAGKPVQDRQGNPVRIICFDRIHDEYPIVGLIKNKTDSGYAEILDTFLVDGRHGSSASAESEWDLVMAPEKKEGWINIYSGYHTSSMVYQTEQEAKAADDHHVVATIKIEWEE